MDPLLEQVLNVVLRDLESSGAILPDIRDEQWSDEDERLTAMLYGPDGSGQGVFLNVFEPVPESIASLADQVQEWAVEALWTAGLSATWPECPSHPNSHPLSATVRDDVAIWICPKTGVTVGAVGKLSRRVS